MLGDSGIGTFGRVLECKDTQDNSVVAIKVVRAIDKYTHSAKIEADILKKVNARDKDNTSLCVRMFGDFMFEKHYCLVFEKLGSSLYDWIKKHG